MFDSINYDPRDFLIQKFEGSAFNGLTKLTVAEGSAAVFFLNGKALDVLGAGDYCFDTETIPLVSAELSRQSGDITDFECGLCFVSLDTKLDINWQAENGTKGTASVKVSDPKAFVAALLKTTDLERQSVEGYLKELIEKNYENIDSALALCGIAVEAEITERAQQPEYEQVAEPVKEQEAAAQEPAVKAPKQVQKEPEKVKPENNRSFLKRFAAIAIIAGVALCIAVAVFLRPQDTAPTVDDTPGTVVSEGLPELRDPDAEITYTELANAKDGDFVLFGSYEQDADTSNGAEQLAWEVVAEEDGVLTLVTKDCIDCVPYNSTFVEIEWKECSLRKWLQGDFYDTAFTAAEKGKIVPSVNKNALDTNYNLENGNDTTDTVYLLSIAEVKNYFSGAEAFRQAKATPYAVSKGVYVDETDTGCCKWWLRSPGDEASKAALVECDGYVGNFGDGVINPVIAVRPVIKVSAK